MDLLALSGLELGALVRARRTSVLELVEAHIALAERLNRELNAIVVPLYEEARARARAADERIARDGVEGLGPYFGVPCTIKENFALRGTPHTAGLVRRKGRVADGDAPTVARLLAAGTIPLGKTNVSELCMWMESDNRVYGRSNNPYDHDRIVGGSSGGEGAIVGSGVSPFGLGADVGGSIRGPAFFNGVFGHKPTPGIVPNTGQFPLAENEAREYLCTGPLARRAEDLMPLLRLFAGPDGEDAVCREVELGDPAKVEWSGRRVLWIEDNGRLPVSGEMRAAGERAALALEKRGAKLVRVKIPALRDQFDIWSAMMGLASETPFGTMLGDGKPISVLAELARLSVGRSEHTTMALMLALTEKVPKALPRQARRLAETGRALRAELAERMGPGGVWLYPPYTTTAPRHRLAVREALMLSMPFAYQGIVNVMLLPATEVPLGLDRQGLPLGVQVIGRPDEDHVTIAGALALEQDFGGWVRPRIARSTASA